MEVATPQRVSPIAVVESIPRLGTDIEDLCCHMTDIEGLVVEEDDYRIVVARDNSFEAVVVCWPSFLPSFRLIWELLVEVETAG